MKHFILLSFLLVFFLSTASYASGNHQINIDQATNSLVAPEGQNYQWYFNGYMVPGAIGRKFNGVITGNYTVQLSDDQGNKEEISTHVMITKVGAIIKVYLLGDSTVSNYNATTDYPQAGWGMAIGKFFDNASVQFINKAVGGRSSRSYYSGPNQIWPSFKDQIVPGDYAFIQFGHNDGSSVPERYTSVPDYKIYLKRYIDELRAKGAFPVLITPMVMNSWNSSGIMTQSLTNYANAMIEVATAEKVPLVDLNKRSFDSFKTLGKDYTTRFLYNTYAAGEYPAPSMYSAGNINNGKNGDGTHFQIMGALENARFITQGIKDLKTDASASKLAQFIKPQYQVSIYVNPKGSDLNTTHSTLYPEGTTITLKTLPKASGTFVRWIDGSGKTISTKTMVTTVITGAAPVSYTAVYQDAVLGTQTGDENMDVSAYPNPFTNEMTIQQDGKFSYRILNVSGQMLESGTVDHTGIIGGSVTSGMYFLEITKNGQVKTIKIDKN